MYLSKLELHGFKSFAQKTTVRFDQGITSIVGPNGCGKTNVADAIRWVLGEQKASTLRSDKMENVIFNGTRTRKPLGMSEVSLTIENTKNILPTEYSEVIITRRLYRSGESEYLLNKIPCRLKDIVDLFMDTGMGPDAYSVIELKMIEDILSERFDDRRKLFEEAAGVTKYKVRRKQALKKLEQTRHDLERINDIIAEVQKSVQSLERQAKKAELYEVYMKELRDLDLNHSEREYSALRLRLDPLKEALNKLIHELETESTAVITEDAALEKTNLELTVIQNELSIRQKEMNVQIQSIQREEEGISVRRERKRSNEESIRRHEQEIAEIHQTLDSLKSPESETEARLENLTKLAASAETAFQLVQETFSSFEQSVSEKRREVGAALQKVQTLNRDLSQIETERERLVARRDAAQNRIGVLRKEISSFTEQSDDLTSELDEIRFELKRSQEQVAAEEARLQQVESQIEETRKQIDAARTLLNASDLEIRTHENRKSFLLSVLESHEDLPEGTRLLIRQGKLKKKKTLADLLVVSDDRYVPVINRWLGDRGSLLVADSAEDALEHLSWLKSEKKGLAGFILTDRVTSGPDQSMPVLKGARPLQEVVSSRSLPDGLLAVLCWGVYVTDDRETAANLQKQHGSLTFLTSDGFIFSDQSAIRGGASANEKESRLGVEAKLNDLERIISQWKEKKEKSAGEITQLQSGLDALLLSRSDQVVRDIRKRVSELEKQAAQLDASIQSSKKRAGYDEQEILRLEQETRLLNGQIEDLLPDIDEKSYELKKLQGSSATMQESLRQLESEWTSQSAQLQDARAKWITFQSQAENAANDLKRLREQKTDLSDRITRRLSDIQNSRQQIDLIIREISEAETRLVSLYETRDQSRVTIDQLEVRQSELRGDVNRIESRLRDLRIRKETLLNLRTGHELKIQETEFSITSLERRILDDYNVELAVKTFTDQSDMDSARLADEVKRYRERIRGLGNVNTGALEEYKAARERFEFMSSQREDLVGAEANLKQVIDEINQTAQTQFQNVFTQIRDNFHSTFATLFEPGDEADLILEDNPDPLEAKIEIIAKPRGKRPQSITLLSGGEKTLTAIALLFAIYLVKPSPFCILDEVDAPLDDANIDRFSKIIRRFSKDTQFIIITHNKKTMEVANTLYGVTMEEKGVSKLVSVRFDEDVPA
ncbi:MAG: chromosome segregation protein SMC [Bacteroidetes bacterium]|nr:chromosome segregation protein SMC [Bacteroidota bacterium]